MKTVKIMSAVIISTAFAMPALAEPSWVQALSIERQVSTEPSDRYTVGKVAGMNKYRPYGERYQQVVVETEIAAFEQSKESAAYHRAVRMDRLPRH